MSILPNPNGVVAAKAASHLIHDRLVILVNSSNIMIPPNRRIGSVSPAPSTTNHLLIHSTLIIYESRLVNGEILLFKGEGVENYDLSIGFY